MTFVYCGQTVGWIKMKLGTEVGLGPGHMPHCVRTGPIPTQKRAHSPRQFSTHVRCGQTAGWIKMPLGTEVGLDPGDIQADIVLDGNQAAPKRGTAPNSRPMSIVANGWMDQDAAWYGGRPRPRPHCVRLGSSPPRKSGTSAPPPLFSPYLLWPNGRPSQLLLSTCYC